MFAVGTTGCVDVWMRGLEAHMAKVAFVEVELAQSSADLHSGRQAAQPSG